MKRKGKAQSPRMLGTVLHMADNKLIVRGGKIKAERITNSIVMTNDKMKIGRVYDVFGPVNRPYVSVKTFKGFKEKQLRKFINKKVLAL